MLEPRNQYHKYSSPFPPPGGGGGGCDALHLQPIIAFAPYLRCVPLTASYMIQRRERREHKNKGREEKRKEEKRREGKRKKEEKRKKKRGKEKGTSNVIINI